MKVTYCIILILNLLVCIQAFSQNDARATIRKGNELYEKQDYKNAAVQYKHACMLDSLSFNAWYNFGNALCQTEKYILATEAYNKALQLTNDKTLKASIFHNVGNVACKQQNYEQAIQFYKQSLLLNPIDDETRYNLAYAQNQLKKQSNEQSDQKKEDEKDKPKPSKFAEECYQKALNLVREYKFTEALETMKNGTEKDKTMEVYAEFTQKLEGIVQIIQNNQE